MFKNQRHEIFNFQGFKKLRNAPNYFQMNYSQFSIVVIIVENILMIRVVCNFTGLKAANDKFLK